MFAVKGRSLSTSRKKGRRELVLKSVAKCDRRERGRFEECDVTKKL